MKLKLLIFLLAFSLSSIFIADSQDTWSKERANEWYKKHSWLCGVNYIPAYAINYTAMWDKSTFNTDSINKELKLMKDIGMNCVRFVMQFAVYEDDPQYFLNTLDKFLDLCKKNKIVAMPTFFDDCIFGLENNPKIGKQTDVLPGWYAWGWSPSPGAVIVVDSNQHYRLENYIKDILIKFKDDKRIILWDLYNEPTNSIVGNRTLPLLEKVISWAREIKTTQPMSIGFYNDNKELNEIILKNSDVITFHWYGNPETTAEQIKKFKKEGRPVICTEWMNRPNNSTIKGNLQIFKDNNVGCFLWGLVNGKTQTHLCWGHRPEQLPYKGVWQHDLFYNNLTPYNQEEIDILKKTIKQ